MAGLLGLMHYGLYGRERPGYYGRRYPWYSPYYGYNWGFTQGGYGGRRRRKGRGKKYGMDDGYGYDYGYDYGHDNDYDDDYDYDYDDDEYAEEQVSGMYGMRSVEPNEFLDVVSNSVPDMDLDDLKQAKYGFDALHRKEMADKNEEATAFLSRINTIISEAIAARYGVATVHDLDPEELLPEDVAYARKRGNPDAAPQPKLFDSIKSVHEPEHLMGQYIEQAKDLKRHMRTRYFAASSKTEDSDDERAFVTRDFNFGNIVGEQDHMSYQYITAGFMHRMFARGYLNAGRESVDDMFWENESYAKDYLKDLGNGIQKSLTSQVKDWDAGIDFATLRGSFLRLEMEQKDAPAGELVDSRQARSFFKTTSKGLKERWHEILQDHINHEKKAIDTLLAQTKDSPSEEGSEDFKSEESRKAFEDAKGMLYGKIADDVTSFWSGVIHCSFGNPKDVPASKDIKEDIHHAWTQHVDATLDFAKNMALFQSSTDKAKKSEAHLYEDGNNLGKVLNQYVYMDMGQSIPKRRVQQLYKELFD